MSTELQSIPVRDLKEHPDNPRKHFDQASLTDLAASIREHGILTPLLVRPNHQGFEVIGGHRRFRAAQLAELEAVPAIVHQLDDRAALELMVLDNLQRDDLHALEEAAGYASLMKEAGYDVEQIAQKISKSGKYVYDRIKLLQLIPELRTVFLSEEITAGHAILLARLTAAEQLKVLGDPRNMATFQVRGLFQPDHGTESAEAEGLDLDDARAARKAVSVRELAKYIDDHVRFHPDEVDLPNLFPETAAALQAAQEEELKVVKVTRDYWVGDDARDDKERTYGRPSWKRADGEMDGDGIWEKRKQSKTCDHSVMGIVVAGPGRGEAFRVCVAKKKCKVHWAAEIKEAEKRANGAGHGKAAPKIDHQAQQRKYQEEARRDEAERLRWKKAAPKLREALAEKLTTAPAMGLVGVIVRAVRRYGGAAPTNMELGKTPESALRYLAFLAVAGALGNEYSLPREAPQALKPYGIDAKKIVDQVSPKPAEKKAEPPKKERKPAGSAAVERIKAAAKKTPPKKRKKAPTMNVLDQVGEAAKKGARARRREKKGATA